MPRKFEDQERLLILDENLTVVARPTTPRPRARRFRRRGKARQHFGRQIEEAIPAPPIDSLMRTRKLIMAALRVWELRHGIHDPT